MGRWIEVVSLKNSPALETPRRGVLHAGEAAVLQLAQEIGADVLLMDDRTAVVYARSIGLAVVPTLAIYIRAKRMGVIPSVRHKADRLRGARFRLSEQDYLAVLRAAGEL